MRKFLKVFMNISLIQIISWFIFILWDYFDETTLIENVEFVMNLIAIVIIVFPIMITIGYLILENKICTKIQISKRRLCTYVILTWVLETASLTMVIINLVENDKWIIHQGTVGWENFLNGIEYLLVPFYNAVSPCVIIIFQRIIYFIYKIFNKIRKNSI